MAGNGDTRRVTARRAELKTEGPARIGVLALQGDVREHVEILKKLGVEPVEVRGAEELEGLAGLIVPGGESTAIGNLMVDSGGGRARGWCSRRRRRRVRASPCWA